MEQVSPPATKLADKVWALEEFDRNIIEMISAKVFMQKSF